MSTFGHQLTPQSKFAMTREQRHENGPGLSALSRTGNSKGYFKRNGEYIAVPFSTHSKPERSGSAGKLNSTYMESFIDPSKTQERLTPYHWNAPRSRLDYVKSDAIPHRRYCKPRNQMSYDPKMPQAPGYQQFRTTNMNYFSYPKEFIEWHQGIVSTASKLQHKKQQTS